ARGGLDQEMLLGPRVALALSLAHAAPVRQPAQMARQRPVHAPIAARRLLAAARVPGGQERARPTAQQRLDRAGAAAHIGDGAVGAVGRLAIGPQQAYSSRSPNSASRWTCTDISRPKPNITVSIA